VALAGEFGTMTMVKRSLASASGVRANGTLNRSRADQERSLSIEGHPDAWREREQDHESPENSHGA
jgi:hypothetical protein